VVQLAYIATILEREYPTMVIDALNEEISLESVVAAAKRYQPTHIFMATSSAAILYEKKVVAKRIKEVVPDATIASVGDTIPHLPEVMGPPIDVAIIGEAERTCRRICGGDQLRDIPGIMYLEKGKLKINAKAELLTPQELEGLPFPNWSLLNYKLFTYYPLLSVAPVVPILSSRGCPYACGYCSYSKNMGGRWRARTAQNVVDELENNVLQYGIKGVFFRDPLFSLDQERVREMCRLLLSRGLRIRFVFETRPELLTRQLVDELYTAGCRAINLGIEDIHPKVLRSVGRKPVDIQHITRIVGYAERRGIRITCFFILGLPDSTRKLVEETVAFSIALNPSHAEYKVLTPYPGTEVYRLAKRRGWIQKEGFGELGGYTSVMRISDELDPDYLNRASSEAFSKFYFRGSYFLREIYRGTFFSKSIMVIKTLWNLYGWRQKKREHCAYNHGKIVTRLHLE
jgi:anaerobic magnesium-protoporphyrin IX monomethyl ester cyclase